MNQGEPGWEKKPTQAYLTLYSSTHSLTLNGTGATGRRSGMSGGWVDESGEEDNRWQRIYCGQFLGRKVIVKERFPKKYRHPVLDRKLTTRRVKEVSSSWWCWWSGGLVDIS